MLESMPLAQHRSHRNVGIPMRAMLTEQLKPVIEQQSK